MNRWCTLAVARCKVAATSSGHSKRWHNLRRADPLRWGSAVAETRSPCSYPWTHQHQYASELVASLPFLVPSAFHVLRSTALLMNLTDPSQNAVLAPPGCREDAATTLATPDQGRPPTSLYQHDLRFGGRVWL